MNEVKFETFRRKTLTSFAGRVVVCAIVLIAVMQPSGASDWEEDSKPAQPVQNKPIPSKPTQSNASSSNSHTQATKKAEPKRIKRQPVVEPEDGEIQPFSGLPTNNSAAPTDSFPEPGSNAPLQGKIEKTHSKAGQELRGMEAQSGSTDPLSGRAIDDELRGMVKDGSLKSLAPAFGENGEPLKGRAELAGGKGNLLDPDEDDQELMVEWDRWHNRFLRAVQLGMQEAMNNPDPEDYERPRVDPVTGNFTSRYPLGTGAAFSCQVTSDGQIKNLEIIEPSGFPKYDKALLRSVQSLAGTRLLVFPKGSHRRTVMQPGRIKTATSNDFKYHHFGDVEKIRGR